MPQTFVFYSLIPMLTAWLAITLTLTAKPRGIGINLIQAFSAGILLAGISAELLPKLNFHQHALPISIALLAGLGLMLLLAKLNPGCCSSKVKDAPLAPFITAFSIEFFLTGVLIVLAGSVSHMAALIVAISLSICSLVCGMTVATRFITVGHSTAQAVFQAFCMSLLFPIGGILTWALLGSLSGVGVEILIAFGVGVLLYLATADLLMAAYEKHNGILKVAFFIGFLLILILHAKI
jgi:zinc transporter ZupT